MIMYNRKNIAGDSHEAALGSSVSSSWAFFPAGRPSFPFSQPRARCQRGARASLSAVVGIFSAYMVTFAGKIT